MILELASPSTTFIRALMGQVSLENAWKRTSGGPRCIENGYKRKGTHLKKGMKIFQILLEQEREQCSTLGVKLGLQLHKRNWCSNLPEEVTTPNCCLNYVHLIF